jgi:hypothetical protein
MKTKRYRKDATMSDDHEVNEMITMLLELQLTGEMTLSERLADIFFTALKQQYIEPRYSYDLISTHTDEWKWSLSEKGLRWLDEHR